MDIEIKVRFFNNNCLIKRVFLVHNLTRTIDKNVHKHFSYNIEGNNLKMMLLKY